MNSASAASSTCSNRNSASVCAPPTNSRAAIAARAVSAAAGARIARTCACNSACSTRYRGHTSARTPVLQSSHTRTASGCSTAMSAVCRASTVNASATPTPGRAAWASIARIASATAASTAATRSARVRK
ncbi:hypothetical protein CHU93_06350 [Sandarakinorhabdus cyanobacteriorum]|uniref:Uncharacterized protein n=1 Tax=Sandarakinorhabdus cyanobacteriorum TaxID=1981098 RepID=A0A255YNF3_9SPHN|nr:hypothetical protein CHU93_06350 [Sandarakinorhabdus cyanobacteriorum]